MISKIRKLSIESCAEDLIRELQIAAFPVNPIKIATDRGITVQSWKPSKKGVSGFLMKQGDAFGIGYSSFVPNQGFINFTIGHELGHYFVPGHVEKLFRGPGGIHYSESGFISADDTEKEADLFSATLLMPGTLFRSAMRGAGGGFKAIEALSNTCATSITATAIRFAEFSENAVAIVLSEGGTVTFCCLSNLLRERSGLAWLKRGDGIPGHTATARFQKDPSKIINGERCESCSMLDDWLDGAPHIEMNEDIIGLGGYGRTLTVLFTDEDLEEDEEDIGEWKPRFQR
jgi:hypothetical protein